MEISTNLIYWLVARVSWQLSISHNVSLPITPTPNNTSIVMYNVCIHSSTGWCINVWDRMTMDYLLLMNKINNSMLQLCPCPFWSRLWWRKDLIWMWELEGILNWLRKRSWISLWRSGMLIGKIIKKGKFSLWRMRIRKKGIRLYKNRDSLKFKKYY